MSERYDATAAAHYAAFRPPLHAPILARLIRPGESFRDALDVGCGTGRSTVALVPYCERIVGLDASREMLTLAPPHPKVTYVHAWLDADPALPVDRFDLVTFAGSLFYAKSPALSRALERVCAGDGTVLVYDFAVHADPFMADLDTAPPVVEVPYDYEVGLADWDAFETVAAGRERVSIDLTPVQLAHLLLSDSNHHDVLARRHPGVDLFPFIVNRLGDRGGQVPVAADLYFARYRVRQPAGGGMGT